MKYLTSTKTYRPGNLMSEMDRMMESLFDTSKPVRNFNVDIAQTGDGYRIEADLPGFKAEEVDVRIEDNLLVIEAKHQEEVQEKKEEDVRWVVKERSQSDRKRSFVLPEDVDKSGIEAKMADGGLSVLLKKKPESKPFSVKITGK